MNAGANTPRDRDPYDAECMLIREQMKLDSFIGGTVVDAIKRGINITVDNGFGNEQLAVY